MQAVLISGPNEYPKLQEIESPELLAEEVQVQLYAAALNHRDVWISKGKYPGIHYPVLPGSDGAGRLNEQDVIINPGMNWGPNTGFQGKDFEILGMPRFGTFGACVNVPKSQIHIKPEYLSWEEAAALPLAGVTAFRALFTQGHCRAGQKVFINGIGGGVALLAFQMALAAGCTLGVSSGNPEKLEKGKAMGAAGVVNYKSEKWGSAFKKEFGAFDLIIDSAGGAGFMDLVDLCKPGGRIVTYGGSRGLVKNFSPQKIFWKQISIIGTSMGSAQDFAEMLDFCALHQIKPTIDRVFPLREAQAAFDYLESGQQFGKVVLKIRSDS